MTARAPLAISKPRLISIGVSLLGRIFRRHYPPVVDANGSQLLQIASAGGPLRPVVATRALAYHESDCSSSATRQGKKWKIFSSYTFGHQYKNESVFDVRPSVKLRVRNDLKSGKKVAPLPDTPCSLRLLRPRIWALSSSDSTGRRVTP